MTEKSRQEENSKTTDAAGGQGGVRQGGKHQERVAQGVGEMMVCLQLTWGQREGSWGGGAGF